MEFHGNLGQVTFKFVVVSMFINDQITGHALAVIYYQMCFSLIRVNRFSLGLILCRRERDVRTLIDNCHSKCVENYKIRSSKLRDV